MKAVFIIAIIMSDCSESDETASLSWKNSLRRILLPNFFMSANTSVLFIFRGGGGRDKF